MEQLTTEELIIVTRALIMHMTDDRVVNDYSPEEVEALAIKTMNIVANPKALMQGTLSMAPLEDYLDEATGREIDEERRMAVEGC